MTDKEKRLCSLQLMAYGLYQMDWCADRMIDIQRLDYERGINGEIFACFEEFKQNEFLDNAYMESLLPPELYVQYRELVPKEVAKNA